MNMNNKRRNCTFQNTTASNTIINEFPSTTKTLILDNCNFDNQISGQAFLVRNSRFSELKKDGIIIY